MPETTYSYTFHFKNNETYHKICIKLGISYQGGDTRGLHAERYYYLDDEQTEAIKVDLVKKTISFSEKISKSTIKNIESIIKSEEDGK